MSGFATWDKIIGAVGSTNNTFGGEWGNLISDYLNGINIGLIDPSKLPKIGTLTRYKHEKLALFDTDESHELIFSVDDIDTGPQRKLIIRRLVNPYETDYIVTESNPQEIFNKIIDFNNNILLNISKAALPALTAYEDEANIFTEPQTIFKNSETLETLYRDVNTNSSRIALNFDAKNNASPTPLQKTYAAIKSVIVDNTSGSEDGQIEIHTRKDGTLTRNFTINHLGNTFIGPDGYLVLSPTGLTAQAIMTFPNSNQTLLGRTDTATVTGKTILDSGTGNQIGVHVPFTFTIYQTATQYVVRNNHTGALQTFANTDFAPALEWAIDNVVNVGLGTQSDLYGGGIFIQRGKYIATSTINPDIDTATRHGITVAGEGWGTEINLAPSSAQTDGFLIDMAAFTLKDMRITANDQVTNLIHLIGHGPGQRRNDHLFLENLQIEGPNVQGGWLATAHVANQIGILMDGTTNSNFYNTIRNCKIHSFEKGIWFKGQQTTSCFCIHNAFKWCETAIEVSDTSGQLTIDGAWIQGDTFDGTNGIKVSSGAGGYVYIDHIHSELHRENPPGTPVACQTVLIESGVGNCFIGKHISNAKIGDSPLYKLIVNNSSNVNHTPLNWNYINKNFITLDYDTDNIIVNANRKLALKTGSFMLSDTGNNSNWIFKAGGDLAASVNVVFPLLAGGATHPDYTLVFEDHPQPLINKTISGSSNTISNIPDSALSSNVALENVANTFTEPQKIQKDVETLFTAYRPSNTAGHRVSIDLAMNNSTPEEIAMASIRTTANTFTAGSEASQIEFYTRSSGVMARRFLVNSTGSAFIGNNARVALTETGLTNQRVFTFVDSAGKIPVQERMQVSAMAGASAHTPVDTTYIVLFFDTDTNKLSIKANGGGVTMLH